MSRTPAIRGSLAHQSKWSRPAAHPGMRRPLLVAAVVAALTVLVLGISFAGESSGRSIDHWFAQTLDGTVSTAAGYKIGWIIGTAGDPVPAGILVLLLTLSCLLMRRWRLSLAAAIAQVLIGIITTLLKHLVGRSIHDGSLSFPSGHTAQLTGLALILGLLFAERITSSGTRAALLVLISGLIGGGSMAWSQISEQVHYASDTAGGFCVAVAVVCLTVLIVDGLCDWRGRSRKSSSAPEPPRASGE